MVSLNLTLLRKWLSSPVHNLGQLMKNSIDLLTKDCPNPATSDQTAKPSPSPTTMKEEEEEEARLESARARDKLDTVSFKKSPNARNDDVNIIELVTQPTVSELKNWYAIVIYGLCPLTSLFSLFYFSEQQLRAKSRLHTVVELICSEITEFCSRHNWLCEVNRTVQHWKKNSCEQLSKMTAEEVEVKAKQDSPLCFPLVFDLIIIMSLFADHCHVSLCPVGQAISCSFSLSLYSSSSPHQQ